MKKLTLLLSLLAAACSATSPDVAGGAVDDFDVGGDRPPTVRTLHAMARVLANQGRDGQCELVLLKLTDEYPDFGPAYVELAELYVRNGHADEAVRVLGRGVELIPDDAVLRNDYGMALFLRSDYERALFQFEAASTLDPYDARSRANAASALGMMGRYDEALELYLQVLTRVDAYHNVGVLAEARGDGDRAAGAFEAAAEAAAAEAARDEARQAPRHR